MSNVPLDSFEKENKVIDLHIAQKTRKEIAQELHMSLRDVCKFIKKYQRQQRKVSVSVRTDSLGNIKKPSRTRAYEMFLNKKAPVEVAITLNCTYLMVRRYWMEYLQLRKNYEFFKLFINHEGDLRTVLSIFRCLSNMNVSFREIQDVLAFAGSVNELKKKYDEYSKGLEEAQKSL